MEFFSDRVEASAPSATRRHFIGGSDARIIMNPDEAALIRLWREKRGEVEPENLEDNLVVQLGVATEALNRTWYERNTGRAVTDVQRRAAHPIHTWMRATLDGWIAETNAVFESKFMLPWSFSEEAAAENTWRSFSTICGSRTRRQPSCLSSLEAASGSK